MLTAIGALIMSAMADSFAERWAAKERTLGEDVIASPMVACGTATLPAHAGPYLNFKNAATPRSVWDVFHLSKRRYGAHHERLSRYMVIGSDGAGNPICLRGDSGAVVMVDHENLFEGETFINSSVEQLAECMLAYMGERDPERFRAAVREIDAPAMGDPTFWSFEADNIIEEIEAEEAFVKIRKERAARPRGPLGWFVAVFARVFGRG